jgi:hypothetical protein
LILPSSLGSQRISLLPRISRSHLHGSISRNGRISYVILQVSYTMPHTHVSVDINMIYDKVRPYSSSGRLHVEATAPLIWLGTPLWPQILLAQTMEWISLHTSRQVPPEHIRKLKHARKAKRSHETKQGKDTNKRRCELMGENNQRGVTFRFKCYFFLLIISVCFCGLPIRVFFDGIMQKR